MTYRIATFLSISCIRGCVKKSITSLLSNFEQLRYLICICQPLKVDNLMNCGENGSSRNFQCSSRIIFCEPKMILMNTMGTLHHQSNGKKRGLQNSVMVEQREMQNAQDAQLKSPTGYRVGRSMIKSAGNRGSRRHFLGKGRLSTRWVPRLPTIQYNQNRVTSPDSWMEHGFTTTPVEINK